MTHYYTELFAGAGGMSRGLEAAGFHAAAHAEIEPHARAVLRTHWPDTRLDGDVTQINGADYRGITLLSGGSPCQDLSVAGKRAGLAGSRSSLFHEQVRIWHESQAPYFLWENVYGALSSNAGRDFATVLSALVGATVTVPVVGRGKSARPKWQRAGVASGPTAVAAWRVLDLQHFGPPQRRVRVFVLAARAGGVDPAEVLALREGVCGHPSPRQQARERTAGRVGTGAESGGVAFGIGSHAGAADAEVSNKSHAAGGPSGMGINEELSNSLRAGRTTAVAHVLAWDNELNASTAANGPLMARAKSGGDRNGVIAFDSYNQTTGDVSHTLRDPNGTFGDALPAVLAFHHTQTPISGDVSPAIGRTTDGMGVMDTWPEVAMPLMARDAKGPRNYQDGGLQISTVHAGRPRRLTPKECERLMSWPDEWTRYGTKDDGTAYELSDTARYRLCGNGVASVVSEWIATRLMNALHRDTL